MAKRKNVIAPDDEKALVAMDSRQKEIEKVEELYGDGFPYDRFRLEAGIKARNEASIAMMIQNGKDYWRIKAHEPHGEFIVSAMRSSGKSRNWVYWCMRMAETWADPQMLTRGQHLELGAGQARAMTLFEKPILKEYLDGGPLGDIPHDDVAAMSRGELEDEARKLRGKTKNQKERHEETVKKMSEELADLRMRYANTQPPTREERVIAELNALDAAYMQALGKINGGILDALNVVRAGERVQDADPLLLGDWLGKFDAEMQTFHEWKDQWLDEVDNASPITLGAIKDVSKLD